ncbi:hypothetical protein HYX58_04400 [Candidatus Dependentiae bacterium]|nr:hypothetical protein [Candidatus Dependentiae bacterium]
MPVDSNKSSYFSNGTIRNALFGLFGAATVISVYKYVSKKLQNQEYKELELTLSEQESLAYYAAGTAFFYLLNEPIVSAICELKSFDITSHNPLEFTDHSRHIVGRTRDDIGTEIKFLVAGKATLRLFQKPMVHLGNIIDPIGYINDRILDNGLSEALPLLNYEKVSKFLTTKTNEKIEAEIIDIVTNCHKEAYELLEKNQEKVQKVALLILEKKKMTLQAVRESLDISDEASAELQKAKQRKLIAYHEAGHAIVHFLNPETNQVWKDTAHYLTIKSEDDALGQLRYHPFSFLRTQKNYKNQIMTELGGMAATEIVFNAKTTGCSDDLKKASDKVLTLASCFKHVNYSELISVSESTKEKVENEIKETMSSYYEETKQLLKANRTKLDALAQTLLEKETLSKDEIVKIIL